MKYTSNVTSNRDRAIVPLSTPATEVVPEYSKAAAKLTCEAMVVHVA